MYVQCAHIYKLFLGKKQVYTQSHMYLCYLFELVTQQFICSETMRLSDVAMLKKMEMNVYMGGGMNWIFQYLVNVD